MSKRNLNLIVWAMWIALLAASIQVIDQLIGTSLPIGHSGAWFAFMAWAVYFLGGGTALGGFKGFISMMLGVIAGIIIVQLVGVFSFLGDFWKTPVAIFFPVIPVLCLERIKILDYIPALFVGCGAYFGIINYFPAAYGEAVTDTNVLIFQGFWGFLGIFYGWFSLQGKTVINKMIPTE